MTDEEILSLRRLHDADCEPWSGDAEYGYECICGKTLYLAAEMEPRGLCDDCKERLMTAVPALLDEVERLRKSDAALVEALAASQTGYDTIRAEADRMRPVYKAAKRVRSRLRNHEGRWNIEEGDLADAIDAALAKESR